MVETLVQVAVMLLGAGAVYGGIRADLRAAQEKAEAAMRSASLAHRRIDDVVGWRCK